MSSSSVTTLPASTPKHRTSWRKTLFFRVVVLCGVLLLCLLGMIIVLMRYYLSEAMTEMEAQATKVAETVFVKLEENPNLDDAELTREITQLYQGYDIGLEPSADGEDTSSFAVEREKDGTLMRVVKVPLKVGERHAVLTLRVAILPGVEFLRAFTHRYIAALMGVFLLTLALMVYFIARNLRPLTQLSETCAAISTGDLRVVNTKGAYGEIRALEDTFNTMVAALREKEIMETKLRQAQRLSALGNLAAGVAHDVRNPLNAIKLLSSHALDLLDDPESRAAKPVQTIRAEVGRLEDIVAGFLSLAKESELSPQPCRIDELLEDGVRLFKKDAEDRQIRLTADLNAGHAVLMLDPKHWTRAILNVLLNALEACPPGGRVRVLSRITERACEIEIRDDGPGLPRETLDRVFDPYYTTKPGGTGLGLSITRGIVEEHGGTIEIFSSAGQGCQVLISLPLDKTRAG
jgi:signal transduction histidine kinase